MLTVKFLLQVKQEQVAQPGSGEEVDQAEQNLLAEEENVQQSENIATKECQEIQEIEVAETEF